MSPNTLTPLPLPQALLPYLTQFVTDEVARSLKDLDVLHALLAMTAALLQNPQACPLTNLSRTLSSSSHAFANP